LLREVVIPATGKTRSEIAALLGISRQHLYDILNERKPVSPTVAVRLGKLFGDGAGVWARMQSANSQVRSGEYPRSRRRWREKSERSACQVRIGRMILNSLLIMQAAITKKRQSAPSWTRGRLLPGQLADELIEIVIVLENE
jgi:addiction module HigA family antidote